MTITIPSNYSPYALFRIKDEEYTNLQLLMKNKSANIEDYVWELTRYELDGNPDNFSLYQAIEQDPEAIMPVSTAVVFNAPFTLQDCDCQCDCGVKYKYEKFTNGYKYLVILIEAL